MKVLGEREVGWGVGGGGVRIDLIYGFCGWSLPVAAALEYGTQIAQSVAGLASD